MEVCIAHEESNSIPILFFSGSGQIEMAAECHAIALSVQASAPIVPFSTIPLAFE